MPAPVLVVHDEIDTRQLILTALQAAGYASVGFSDPMRALETLEADTRVRVLLTRVNFGKGKLNGIALARLVRYKRPSVKVVFVGQPENRCLVDGVGDFLPQPVDLQAVVDAVGGHLVAPV